MPEDFVQIYATTEQLQRLAALSCDALAGIEFSSNSDQNSDIIGHYVSIDNIERMEFFTIPPDGSLIRTT